MGNVNKNICLFKVRKKEKTQQPEESIEWNLK